jgi:hypothetical protein
VSARWLAAAAGVIAAALTGCATLQAPFDQHLSSEAPLVRGCAEWFHMLDVRVEVAGVRDAQDTLVRGFPYLRASRLLAALRPRAAANEDALHALADRMLALDLEARRYEIMNLPSGQVPALREALERTQHCGRLLRELDLAKPEGRRELLERAQVPDDYRTAQRILGLYAFTRLAFAEGVQRHESAVRDAFRREPALPSGASLIRHAPPPAPPAPPLQRSRAATVLARAAGNPLGIPEPGESEMEELLAAYAPSFEIEVKGDYDRFGALRWQREDQMRGSTPLVDGGQLAVYAHPAWTLYRDRVLLQLVYTIWFPERPPASEGDLLAGKLDGITWRVTLAPDGEPLVYDAIHPCGCYHLFFPTPRAQARPAPRGPEEWMFAPQSLPRVGEGERPVLRIASGTHYIERVTLAQGSDSLVRYELRPYGDLRSMQRLAPGRASAFGADGLVPGTERAERLLYWPMGIVSAGAMRQWGRQATAFIGRRHFDDADLFEKRFSFDLQ